MPFARSVMDSRRRLALRVLSEGVSVSSAAREAGISRTTAYLWLARAKEAGVGKMAEVSRRPNSSPGQIDEQIAELVTTTRAKHPNWGSRKLRAVIWPGDSAPICERTVDRILARAGLLRPVKEQPLCVGRFERDRPNELWQMDFKGLGEAPPPYKVLSVIDDCTRFNLGLEKVRAATGELVFDSLWGVFGRYGLPDAILSDNEHCFHCRYSKGPSLLEARLWRLGIKTPHGRARHPQTQGKVERFHRTLQESVGSDLRDPVKVSQSLDCFRQEYNWVRPHEALDLAAPGSVYKPSAKNRPDILPQPTYPEGADLRFVSGHGIFKYQGRNYKAGKGLAGERVAIVHEQEQAWVHYAGVNFAKLGDTLRR